MAAIKIELTPEQVSHFTNFVKAEQTARTSGKEIFVTLWELHKVHRDNPIKVLNVAKRAISDLTQDANIITKVEKINKTAKLYVEFDVLTKFSDLYLYNIERIVGLFDLIRKNHGKTTMATEKELRAVLAEVWTPGMTPSIYNNAIKDALAKFMRGHKMVENADGVFSFTNAKKVIAGLLHLMSITELQLVMDMVKDAQKEVIATEAAPEAGEAA